MTTLRATGRPGVWSFETDAMAGEISADPENHVHGVTSLIQKGTGRQVVREKLFCLHLYRVLARNHWLSQCRDAPHEAVLEGEDLVIQWRKEALGPGLEAEARYRVSGPDRVDLTVSLRNTGRWHRDLEVYTSNYFDPSMRPGLYTVTPFRGPVSPGNPATLTLPEDNPSTHHCYCAWPRDILAAGRFTDGRWEYGTHSPVPWAIGRWYAYPFGFYVTEDRGTAVAVLARAEDCFGMCTSYHSDDPQDGVAHHNSLYHNLVGCDAGPGWARTLRQRMFLGAWEDDALVKAYQEFDACAAE